MKIADDLYKQMQAELKTCQERGLDPEKEMEISFQVCTLFWLRLKNLLTTYEFRSKQEEIRFFKYGKQRFTSLMEYYSLVYHALMFMPPEHTGEAVTKFWKRQAKRIDNYARDHAQYYRYYKECKTEKDHIYFIRSRPLGERAPQFTDKHYATGIDKIFTKFMALEQYKIYAEEKIRQLERKAS